VEGVKYETSCKLENNNYYNDNKEDERENIINALQEYDGDVTKAAKKLKTSRATLYRRIKAFGINPKNYKR
jgi:transcriptional regulator of acetoin/glycerol metabolism